MAAAAPVIPVEGDSVDPDAPAVAGLTDKQWLVNWLAPLVPIHGKRARLQPIHSSTSFFYDALAEIAGFGGLYFIDVSIAPLLRRHAAAALVVTFCSE